jgi:chromosome partitioning protein
MVQVIALANQKGGVAKTTSTVNLAYALVQRGKRVLVIDFDPQGSLTTYYNQDKDALKAEEKTIYHALIKNKDITSLVIPGNPALLPSSDDLASAESELARDWNPVESLRDKIKPLREHYDYILIDCAPTLGLLTGNALTAADAVFIPVETAALALDGISDLFDTIERVRRRPNPDLRIIGVLPTKYNQRNLHDNECLNVLRQLEPRIRVFDPVNRSTAFDKSSAARRPALELFPDTPGVKNYYKVAEHIIAYG